MSKMWKNVTDTDKKHAKIVYQEFRAKSVGAYYVFFIQCDKFLLPDVFRSFPNVLKYMTLTLLIFSASGLAWKVVIKEEQFLNITFLFLLSWTDIVPVFEIYIVPLTSMYALL